MRNLNLEAAIWYFFCSAEFFESAALECEATMNWFGNLAISQGVVDFGRNNQIFDKFKKLAHDFRRGAEYAKLGEYKFIWGTASCVSGNVRGMMEQPLHGWMTEEEYQEFSDVRIGRLMAYASKIERALNNSMFKGVSFFEPNPKFPERRNDDDGFPGDEIISEYKSEVEWYKDPLFWKLPEPLPEYVIDRTRACSTGEEVPWTGVWYPETGIENHSLTFAIRGKPMQPAFRVIKTNAQLRAEGDIIPYPETVAVATTWHPLVPAVPKAATEEEELWSKAGAPCPKAGVWQPTDPGAARRTYQVGEPMGNLGSAYGLTVWRWIADR